jgi:hypothetical protein
MKDDARGGGMGALYFALLGFCELYGGFNRVEAVEKR